MDIAESITDIEVQDPNTEDFSAADLRWTKLGTTEHHDEVAIIPFERVDQFIIGECCNVECPTRFHVERGRKRSIGSLKNCKSDDYLEYKLYWCSFGPENYGEGGGILPSRKFRLNTRNRAARPQSMRGCTCHFVVKRLYARPSLALIIYNDRRHVNKAGFLCHGPLDKDAIGPGARRIPYVGNEVQQQTMSMIYVGIPEENVLEKHIEGILRYTGPDAQLSSLATQYVKKLGMIIKRSTHELDLDDQASVKLWVERNKKSVFFYQDPSEDDSFILGIQTEWQLQQMIRFGHHSLIACDSSFAIKKLKYPICSLLAFDSRQISLPVAWIVTRSSSKLDVSMWMKALLNRARGVQPEFRINGFLIDDAALEIDVITEIFSCPILFSTWRLRRSWLRNIIKRCSKNEIQHEIFNRLGDVAHSIWSNVDTLAILEDLMNDFIDESSFITYFRSSWLPKIEMWLTTMKNLPLASVQASCAIEAYHVKLKSKLFNDSHLSVFQRVDWLVHKLTTELHSSYWLDRYADESDSFPNVKQQYVVSTSWQRALQIPDAAVVFDDQNPRSAKIFSLKEGRDCRIVHNPGSEFAFCRCEWSLQGNLCKHVVKVNMVIESQRCLSIQSLRDTLTSLLRLPVDDSLDLDISMGWTCQIVDQIKQLVELHGSNDVVTVVNKMPLKWMSKKIRTSTGSRSSNLKLSSTLKKTRKRRRLSRLK